jgi:hypothetical protein
METETYVDGWCGDCDIYMDWRNAVLRVYGICSVGLSGTNPEVSVDTNISEHSQFNPHVSCENGLGLPVLSRCRSKIVWLTVECKDWVQQERSVAIGSC